MNTSAEFDLSFVLLTDEDMIHNHIIDDNIEMATPLAAATNIN